MFIWHGCCNAIEQQTIQLLHITECLLYKVFSKRREVMKTRAEQNGQSDGVSLKIEIQCVWMNAGKKCLHMLTGRVQFKLCSHNYECKDCAYDQMLDAYDQLLSQDDLPIIAAAQINKVVGYAVPIPVN
jgi:hypothetical protein